MWVPAADALRGRLSEGERRCQRYGVVAPVHVRAVEMHAKLQDRAQDPAGLCCYVCGRPVLESHVWHLDHVRPLVLGGRHELANLEITHDSCNLVKGSRDLYDPPVGPDHEPLLVRLRRMDPEDLWRQDRALARAVLLAPRSVPKDPSIGDYAHDLTVVRVLLNQDHPYRSMTTGAISAAAATLANSPVVSSGQIEQNLWLKLMGFSQKGRANRSVAAEWHDRRLPQHPVLVATRVGRGNGHWGAKGLRLRFSVPAAELSDLVAPVRDGATGGRYGRTTFTPEEGRNLPRRASAYPDIDELDGER